MDVQISFLMIFIVSCDLHIGWISA